MAKELRQGKAIGAKIIVARQRNFVGIETRQGICGKGIVAKQRNCGKGKELWQRNCDNMKDQDPYIDENTAPLCFNYECC